MKILPKTEVLHLVNITCKTLVMQPNTQSTIHAQEVKLTSLNSNSCDTPKSNSRFISDYFLPGLSKEADMETSDRLTKQMKPNLIIYLNTLDILKVVLHYSLRKTVNLIKHQQDM